MNAEQFLIYLQDEMAESIDEPFATKKDGVCYAANFQHQRIGSVIHVRHIPTSNEFTIEVKDIAATRHL